MNHQNRFFCGAFKRLWVSATVVLLTTVGPLVRAQSNVFLIQPLDEWGSGFQLQLAASPFLISPMPRLVGAGMATDPISGITTLRYTLSDPLQVAGDLYLTAPGTGSISDILRFDGNGHVYFFSLKEPGETVFAPADVDALPALLANNVGQEEVLAENGIGNAFAPLPGQPGYWHRIGYNIIAEVPEPGTLPLMSSALLLCSIRGWARRSGLRAPGH